MPAGAGAYKSKVPPPPYKATRSIESINETTSWMTAVFIGGLSTVLPSKGGRALKPLSHRKHGDVAASYSIARAEPFGYYTYAVMRYYVAAFFSLLSF